MLVVIVVLSLLLLIQLLLFARERLRRGADDGAVAAPVPEFLSAPHSARFRRRPVRDSLIGLLDHAGNSWRLFRDVPESKGTSGEITTPTQLASADARRITLKNLPPPPRKD
jgi:hypothetical protein